MRRPIPLALFCPILCVGVMPLRAGDWPSWRGPQQSGAAPTADHSTPALMHGHSFHPNPFLLAADTAMPDDVAAFSERTCAKGIFGRFPSLRALPLILGHAGKLKKYGA